MIKFERQNDLFNNNKGISPYFVALILWYPAFENLFSIIRRLFASRKKISSPDTLHLHQLIYLFFSRYVYKKSKFNNTKTGLIILLYNLIIFYFTIKFKLYYDTRFMVSIILFNVAGYYSSLYQFSKDAIVEGFLPQSTFDELFISENLETIFDFIAKFEKKEGKDWFKRLER